MTTSEQLLLAGLAAVGAFLVVKYAYKLNAHKPASAPPAATGVLGVSPVLNPAAPKTTGDFARYDRGLSSGPVTVAPQTAPLTTGAFTRLDHDTSPVDTPALDTSGSGWVYGDYATASPIYGD